MKRQRIASISGLTACVVLLVAIESTIGGYVGWHAGERYAMTNHFVSELGRKSVSPLAPIFNVGLMVSGVLLGLFAVGVTRLFLGWRRIVVGLLAFTTFVSCFLIGVFPVDRQMSVHLALAFVFFPSALALALFLSTITVFSKRPVLPKWTAVFGFLTAIAFAALVVSPTDALRAMIADPVTLCKARFLVVVCVGMDMLLYDYPMDCLSINRNEEHSSVE